MKKYVLQMRDYPWKNTWTTLGLPFNTLEEAKTAYAQKSPKTQYRIAEAYTVTRYKAVKL